MQWKIADEIIDITLFFKEDKFDKRMKNTNDVSTILVNSICVRKHCVLSVYFFNLFSQGFSKRLSLNMKQAILYLYLLNIR